MSHSKYFFLLIIIFLISCNPRITSSLIKNYPPLEFDEKVTVLEMNDKRPENSEVLGTIKVGDTGFSTKCNYVIVLDKAKTEARKIGGNTIIITEHKKPNFWSTCHRLKATILRIKKQP